MKEDKGSKMTNEIKINYIFLFTLISLSIVSLEVIAEPKQEIKAQVIQQEGVQEALKREKTLALKEVQKNEELVENAKKQAEKADSKTEKSLAEYLLALQNYRASASNTKLMKVKEIEANIVRLKERTEFLKEQRIKFRDNPKQLSIKDLDQVTVVWRNIADSTISKLFEIDVFKLNSPPILSISLETKNTKLNDLANNVDETLSLALRDKEEIEKTISQLNKNQREIGTRLLLNAGRVRSSLLSSLLEKNKYSVWEISENHLEDYLREIKIVPYRFLATFFEKASDFKIMSQRGIRGWFQIGKQLLIIVFVFLLPYLLFLVFRAVSLKLEELKKQIFTRSQLDLNKRTQVALWIGRLNPYLPWFFAYFAIYFSYYLLSETLLEPFIIFLPYLNIYILYRAFLILFSSILAKVLLTKNLEKIKRKQPEVQKTAFKLSVLLFSEWGFLLLVEDTVRPALIYNLVYDSLIAINIAIIAVEARKWKEELLFLSEEWLNNRVCKYFLTHRNFITELIFYPLLFLFNIIYLLIRWFYLLLSQFDFGKKISSEIFKRRLEEANGEIVESLQKNLSDQYKSLFLQVFNLDSSARVSLSRSPFTRCISAIEDWIQEKTQDDLLVLYGNFGIGKSTIVTALAEHFNASIQVFKISVKKKITKRSTLYRILSESLEEKISTPEDLKKYDCNIKKTIIIIDDIHNLYLNTTNGLEAYRSLIELTSLQLRNIFWCFSCNERVFRHLNGLFGMNHFIGSKIELLSWTDAEIQELILKRHQKSTYKLKFDQVISAVHRGDILETSSGLEVQFFRLLWGQSRGNPSTAQELWLSAANQVSDSTIRISVPEFTRPRTLTDLPDETLIVYASIVKHENLSFKELLEICLLSSSTVRQAIKFGEDGMILQRLRYERWRIHPKAQYVVQAQLQGRNLIYE